MGGEDEAEGSTGEEESGGRAWMIHQESKSCS
jgi:hypothetical protein